LADPFTPIETRAKEVGRLRERGRVQVSVILERIDRDVAHRRAQLSALGPAATLARGYAVVQSGRTVVRSTADAPAGTALRIRVADGALLATSAGPEPPDQSLPHPSGRQ
jgi:exodeoxyribonuclease VII large subunit